MLFGKRPFGEGKSQERVLSEGIILNATQVLQLQLQVLQLIHHIATLHESMSQMFKIKFLDHIYNIMPD